ncbi:MULTISPECIES: subtilase-type protease inhibitor [unclassified Streptomyces]|uniref:subtilase-type protease inhibitor n=1 Tax=unclassified Streptomyces TaxID=2593676 RepID=UPI002E0D6019|nr:subtilase-type protease inhibitor [Streptomyces sp. NBC_01197]WSS53131.1 subtilase-type protease inhibitor [Streptomyces sp. NBC_01180]
MRHSLSLKTLGAAALAAAACVTSIAGTAHARPTSVYAPSALVLTIGRGDEAASTVLRAVTLSCAPQPQGTHPASRAACAELKAVGGDLALIGTTPSDQRCSFLWAPVTVTADGVWQGRRVAWRATYGNACQMNATLSESSVFNF